MELRKGNQRRRTLRHETLEQRCVLSTQPLITEFMASNSSTILDGLGASSDWIEIHNPTNDTIDLGGWHLTDSNSNPTKWTFPDTELAPQAYLLVFASNQTATGFIDPLGYRHTTFALSAGGEYLALTDAAGKVVSEFAPSYPQQSADVSYGLDGGGGTAYFTNPTPGSANDYTSVVPATILISEIMYHPSSELTDHEYIELVNTSASSMNLANWAIDSGVKYTLPDITLTAGDYLVVAANPTAFAELYPTVTNVVGGWQGHLSNRGETISVANAAGIVVDSVSYTDQGDWAAREEGPLDYNHTGWVWSDAHDGNGSSLELVSFALGNDSGQNWQASLDVGGTPGSVNSVNDTDNNTAPLVLDVAHYPVIPSSTQDVSITARLVDELNTGLSANLYWRVDGDTSFQVLAMADNGLGPDVAASDLVFTAQIPAMSDGTIIEFYVAATDQAGNTRMYPAATQPSGEQLTNLLYQVDDSFDPSNLPSEGDRSTYRLIMTEAERAELAQIGSTSSDRRSHARMNGTLISVTPSGVEYRYQVGIRNRGESSALAQPNSYHVDIPRDNLWYGLEAFNLNTQYTHSQLAGLKLFQATGGVAEDSQAVEVRVNGTDLSYAGSPSYGVYVQLEATDSVLVANHYPDDDGGNLYKAVRDSSGSAHADFRDLGDDPLDYAAFYQKETNASEADYSDIIELIKVLNYEPDETYYARVSQLVDIDSWLNYFATVAILSSEETSLATGVGDDFIMYRGESDPRFRLIPHDFDTILGQGDTSGSPTSSIYRAANLPVVSRFLHDPQILPAYHAKLEQLLTTTFAKHNFDPLLDDILTGFAPSNRIAEMKSFMATRREYILDLITQPLTAQAPLVTQGGLAHTTFDNVAIYGTAPLSATQSVTANGVVAQYNATTGSWTVGNSTGSIDQFIASGDIWHYLNPGQVAPTSPGNDWRTDNLHWPNSGPSQLGYGDTQTTVVPYVDIDPNTSGTQKNTTTYFQTTFDVAEATSYSSLTLQLLRDDGAVVYLNGVEVIRSNMPAGEITSTTFANSNVNGGEEETFFEYSIDPSLLVEGQNVLAVEIHQDDLNSSDIGMDVELTGVKGSPTSTDGVPLVVGVNRIEVQAFDGPNGTGNLLDTTWVDVWYDNASGQTVGGDITTPQHWTAANSPYFVTSDLVIRDGGVLTIDPGVSVFLGDNTGLTVAADGQLIAEGTADAHITFATNPNQNGSNWNGLTFEDTQLDNRLTYVDQHAGGGTGQAIDIDHGRLTIDHMNWLNINEQILDLVHPTLVVTNSNLPGIGGNETVHLLGLDQGEQLVFENNTFGFNSSGDDVLDLGHSTLTPATIIFRGNTFLGGYDDGVDTDGFPVLLENNTFMNFHLNTSRNTTSNAVSTGYMSVSGQAVSSNLTLIGNVFINNDHHLLIKDLSYATLINNTLYQSTYSGIHLEEPGGTSVLGPGRGAALDGVLFWDNPIAIEGIVASTELTIDHSIVPAELTGYGTGNLTTDDPRFSNVAIDDLSLLPGSPAIGTGPNGSEIGGVQLSDYTPASAATLRITELHFDPTGGDTTVGEVGGTGKSFEFIELTNFGNETIDLSGLVFDDGIDFAFPWQSSLAAGQTIVVASNADLFRSRYGDSAALAGEFTGNLSGDGEQVRLLAADGSVIADFAYEVMSPWPNAAGGYSLEVIDPLASLDDPANWRASTEVNGTPGALSVTTIVGDFDRNGLVDMDDYAMWKSQFGRQVAPGFGADGNADGTVSLADYTLWRDNLGAAVAPVVQPIASPSTDATEAAIASIAATPSTEAPDSSTTAAPTIATNSTAAEDVASIETTPIAKPLMYLNAKQSVASHRSSNASTENSLDQAFADYEQQNLLLLRRHQFDTRPAATSTQLQQATHQHQPTESTTARARRGALAVNFDWLDQA
ncbi:lamin tail domain-containing protein [Aeoliella mucimassa]|nr:lamin tail domain-containing protein [Aeoliella mucimassa]